nr:phosphopantetheine-binding protein [Paenibacillus oenotherae]
MFVITIVTRALEQRAPVRMDDSLKELGMNSLKFIRIIIDIETEYDLTVAPEDAVLHNFQTPSDFVQYILARV